MMDTNVCSSWAKEVGERSKYTHLHHFSINLMAKKVLNYKLKYLDMCNYCTVHRTRRVCFNNATSLIYVIKCSHCALVEIKINAIECNYYYCNIYNVLNSM